MNVSQDLSILHLILNASAVVQAVMLLLAGVSFMSWYYIFRKWFTVKAARAQTEQFERDFWSGGDLNSLYQSAINNRHGTGSMERISSKPAFASSPNCAARPTSTRKT
jgi:biopolymer transport protein TolQ